jgi:hypothetical protein
MVRAAQVALLMWNLTHLRTKQAHVQKYNGQRCKDIMPIWEQNGYFFWKYFFWKYKTDTN